MNTVNFNGNILTAGTLPQPVADKALLETMYWENNGIALWPYHYARLQNSFLKSGYNAQLPDEALLLNEIGKTIQANDITEAKIRFIINTDGRQLFFWIAAIPYHHNDIPFRLCFAEDVVKIAGPFSGIKYHERSIYERAMQQAKHKACDDAILLNQFGRIAETTIANIFWKQGNRTFTPPLSEGCVAGVYRQFYIDNNNVQESPLTTETLLNADEIFLTNALRGIIKVENVEK